MYSISSCFPIYKGRHWVFHWEKIQCTLAPKQDDSSFKEQKKEDQCYNNASSERRTYRRRKTATTGKKNAVTSYVAFSVFLIMNSFNKTNQFPIAMPS